MTTIKSVLVVGSGGREHALIWKLKQSKHVDKIYCASGNAGITRIAKTVDIKPEDLNGLADFAENNKIDLTVVGPEAPLVAGIVDEFEKRGLKIFGPNKAASQLEGSKVFSKQFMKKNKIPTADFDIFDDPEKAKNHIKNKGAPIVVKADGLAAGKGVTVCKTVEEALDAVNKIMVEKKFGDVGNKIIVEDLLKGEEASILAITDGKDFVTLLSSQDHKQIFDGDKGENCYSRDTEILTTDGWKTFDKLTKGDKVATFDVNTKSIFFERPKKIYWMRYKGKMIWFKHRNLDLLVTPNHRMLLQQRRRKHKIQILEAQNVKDEKYVFLTGKWFGKDLKYFTLPEHDYKFNRKLNVVKINFNVWTRFLGIYLSEGSIVDKKEKRVYIAQMEKSKHFSKFKEILDKLPFPYIYEPKKNCFRINSVQLVKYLKQFGKSNEKYVPDYVKNATVSNIKEFLNAYCLGDGDIHQGKMRFSTSSKRMIDDLQELIIKIGCSGIITIDKRTTMINPINKKTYPASPIYSIEIKNRNKTSIRKNYIKHIDYDDYVGCVTVSTGFVLIRRNGRVAISGNTGGMGAYAPAPIIDNETNEKIKEEIIKPTIQGMLRNKTPFKGCLYLGLMITEDGPKVLEYNCRLGDPEAQPVLSLLETDFYEILDASVNGNIKSIDIKNKDGTACCVVMSSGGYPGEYEKGKIIHGLEKIPENVIVFHAGTTLKDGNFVTSGGRVIGVTGIGNNILTAINNAYKGVSCIKWEKEYHRTDIGQKALKKLKLPQ